MPEMKYEKESSFLYNSPMRPSVISKSLADTAALAAQFVESLNPGPHAKVVALSGDLGSGKTAFTKEVGAILGVPRDDITSPTFVIMKIFELKDQKFKHLIHIDAYLLENPEELVKLGWKEITESGENLIVIEWPEMVKGLIPEGSTTISFEHINESTRKITFV